jgi:hypothetical protein
MRSRRWLVGVLLAGVFAAVAPAPARAAVWPFSLWAKKTPVKKPKKPVKRKPGTPATARRTTTTPAKPAKK